ncbi:MAG: aldehyde:ferredoxin oxidoreductase [Clostridia bacterium]|nr:aldehyde:ferredoxin oxidoreductase [Clostridia bacterium]
MNKSYQGKILSINLSSGAIFVEEKDDIFYRKYLGGKGIALYYLLKELKPKIDPLSAENILIVAPSILTGAPVPSLSRYTVAAKSPLTDAYGEAEAGGWFGPELKFAGYDAIIIKGKASHPVYISIIDGKVEIKDARHLWGKTTGETQDIIRDELRLSTARILSIGPAGERLVRYACILNELGHANGRTGMGAVMGSKNLKAIVVKGKDRCSFANPEKVKEIAQFMAREFKNNPLTLTLYELGTSAGVSGLNASGILPTRNFNDGEFQDHEKISGNAIKDEILINRKGCYACSIKCKRVVEVKTSEYTVDSRYGGPEYETVAAFGSLCCNSDLKSIAKANELCNKYALDTISTGATIAFAIECFEQGHLSLADTGGLELRFGDPNIILQLIEMIAFREGIGDLLAEGVKRASIKLGLEKSDLVLEVKGQELPMHDPRGKVSLGLGYAVSPNGANHLVSIHDSLIENGNGLPFNSISCIGLLEPLDSRDYGPKKVRQFVYLMYLWSLLDTISVCIYGIAPRGLLPLNKFVELVEAISGWETSLWELLKAGERTINMARVFNAREGFTRKDDTLPSRLFKSLQSGNLKGTCYSKENFEKDLELFYEMMGWDTKTGNPKNAKLYELDLDWLVKGD